MRYAVISDIHANVEALTAVLRKIDAERVDAIVCAGDLVGYFANPNECLQLLRERGVRSAAGNHDRATVGLKPADGFSDRARRAIAWTRRQLTAENRQFLASLDLLLTVDAGPLNPCGTRFLVVHGALHPEPNDDLYLSNDPAVMLSCEALATHPSAAPVCFVGQTHRRAAFAYRDGAVTPIAGDMFDIAPGTRYLINPGSVGLSRDGDPRASFVVFDSDAGRVQFHRAAYDAAASHAKAGRAGLLDHEPPLKRVLDLPRRAVRRGARTVRRAAARRAAARLRRDPSAATARLRAARNILFVCHGNIIRSAFAARLVTQTVGDAAGVTVRSAGLEAATGDPSPDTAVKAATQLGVDLRSHSSAAVAAETIAASDAIFVMEIAHLLALRSRFPEVGTKTFLLTCLAPDAPLEIADPMDADESVVQQCFRHIHQAVQPIIGLLPSHG